MEENLGGLRPPLDDLDFSVRRMRRRGRSSRSGRKGSRMGRWRKRLVIIEECVGCDEMLESLLKC